MEQALEGKVKIHYHCRILPEEIKMFEERGLRTEQATIEEAHFGRLPSTGMFNSRPPVGLILLLDRDGLKDGAPYTKMGDIDKLMADFDVMRTDELVGRKVWTYFDDVKFVGLSKYKE